jgi:hypothetical protein
MDSSTIGTPGGFPQSPTNQQRPELGGGLPRHSVQQLEMQQTLLLEQCVAATTIKQILRMQVGGQQPALSSGSGGDDVTDDADLGAALQGLQIQRVQHPVFYSRYLRARSELFSEWFDADSESAERSKEEALFRFMPRTWLRSILYQSDDEAGFSEMGLHDDQESAPALLHGWDQQRMYFYRDLESACGEPRVAGVPYVLLVVVAFPGRAVRLVNAEAMQLVSPPLVVPWHVNTAADDDRVRRYQTYQSVVCDDVRIHDGGEEGVSGKEGAYVRSVESPFASSPPAPSPSRSPRSMAKLYADLLSPRSGSSASAATVALSATAKKVYLYDPTQWCPMYLIFL